MSKGGQGTPTLDRDEHVDKNVKAKRVQLYGYDSAGDTLVALSANTDGGLVNGLDYDYVNVVQTDPTTETYNFKTGGPSGTVVRTIVVVYVDATRELINTVTWS